MFSFYCSSSTVFPLLLSVLHTLVYCTNGCPFFWSICKTVYTVGCSGFLNRVSPRKTHFILFIYFILMYISMDTLNLNTWIIMSITIFNPQFSLSSICLSHSLSFSASQSALPHLHLSLCCAEYRTYSISVEVSAFLLPFSSLFFFSVSANFPFPLSSFSLFPS